MTNQTYQENYQTLKRISEELSNDSDLNIDTILPKIETAIKAYNECSDRLNNIEKAIQEKLESQTK